MYHGTDLLWLQVSPHIEDGIDECARAPFRNIFRLCHCAYRSAMQKAAELNAANAPVSE